MKMNRKGFALLAGAASVLVVGASAATLGTLTTQSLGASTAVVASCQSSGLGVSWGTPAYATTPAYTVNTGTITGIAAGCLGKAYSLEIASGPSGGPNPSLRTVTGTLPSSGTTAPLSFTAVDVQSITQVTLVVYG